MKSKFKKFLSLLEEIDKDYGFGPNEEIVDEDKLNEYIKNFIEYSKELGVYRTYLLKLDENTEKSLLERLNELKF